MTKVLGRNSSCKTGNHGRLYILEISHGKLMIYSRYTGSSLVPEPFIDMSDMMEKDIAGGVPDFTVNTMIDQLHK